MRRCQASAAMFAAASIAEGSSPRSLASANAAANGPYVPCGWTASAALRRPPQPGAGLIGQDHGFEEPGTGKATCFSASASAAGTICMAACVRVLRFPSSRSCQVPAVPLTGRSIRGQAHGRTKHGGHRLAAADLQRRQAPHFGRPATSYHAPDAVGQDQPAARRRRRRGVGKTCRRDELGQLRLRSKQWSPLALYALDFVTAVTTNDGDRADGACRAATDLSGKAYEPEAALPTSLSRFQRHSMWVMPRSAQARWALKLGSPSGAGLTASTPNMRIPLSASQCTAST